MALSLPRLIDAPDRYLKSYEVFAAASARLDHLINWAENVFDGKTAAKLQARLSDDDELRVLGVGSGPGKYEQILVCAICMYRRIFV